jgi:ferric-dicitrate binding protein FerR (iron transport regulator)
MTLPSPSGRWVKKTFRGRVDRGEARILTGAGFPGHRLRLEVPGGTTLVTGTLLSVATDGTFVCVCVVEGIAWVGRTSENMEAIPPGMRKVMFTDTRPGVVLPIEPAHAAGLIQFRDSTAH